MSAAASVTVTGSTGKPDFAWVVAIDFGTAMTGIAYSQFNVANPLTVEAGMIQWSEYDNSTKIPTRMLLDEKYRCVAFGLAAEKQYLEWLQTLEDAKQLAGETGSGSGGSGGGSAGSLQSTEVKQYHLFRHWKMHLYGMMTLQLLCCLLIACVYRYRYVDSVWARKSGQIENIGRHSWYEHFVPNDLCLFVHFRSCVIPVLQEQSKAVSNR